MESLRIGISVAAGLLFALESSSALADVAPTTAPRDAPASAAREARDTTSVHGVDIVAIGAIGDAKEVGVDASLAASWRLTPRIAVGIRGGFNEYGESHNMSLMIGPDAFNEQYTHFFRATPTVRWDFSSTRAEHAWVGAAAGMLASVEHESGDSRSRTGYASCFGLELGIAGHPVPGVSMGPVLEWLYTPATSHFFDRYGGVFLGIAVGAHIPVGRQVDR